MIAEELKPQPKPEIPPIVPKPEEKTSAINDSDQNKSHLKDSLELLSQGEESGYGNGEFSGKIFFSFNKLQAFAKWVDENYNRNLLVNIRVRGTIILQFSVNEKGFVDSAEVVTGLNPVLDNEAKRVILSSPRWKPLVYKGYRRRMLCIIPIHIRSSPTK